MHFNCVVEKETLNMHSMDQLFIKKSNTGFTLKEIKRFVQVNSIQSQWKNSLRRDLVSISSSGKVENIRIYEITNFSRK